MEGKSLNPFAIGAQFLDYCVKQGWLQEEGSGKHKKWYATEEGKKKLKKFGIEVVLETGKLNMPWFIVILGYLLGSIPTAYIVGRVLKGVDIRQIGDGNMGAANTFRQLGPKAGVTVGIIDAGKGAAAVLIAQAASLPLVAVLLTGTAVVVGHNWPVFLGFRGGRGEATTIGVLLVTITKPMLIMAIPAIAAHFILRDTTKAAAVLFVPLPFICWLAGLSGALIAYSIALPCLVGFTHFLRTRRVAEISRSA